MPRFNRGGEREGERAGVERRRGEGKEKAEGMTEGRGRKESMGNSDGGNCATAPRGDRRHCILCSINHTNQSYKSTFTFFACMVLLIFVMYIVKLGTSWYWVRDGLGTSW